MYPYKIRVSLNVSDDERAEQRLNMILDKPGVIHIKDDEYGVSTFETGMAIVQTLGRSPWFLKDGKELRWYNGEDYDVLGDYYEEDSLAYFRKKQRV